MCHAVCVFVYVCVSHAGRDVSWATECAKVGTACPINGWPMRHRYCYYIIVALYHRIVIIVLIVMASVFKASSTCPVEWMAAEAPLFILYTSGAAMHTRTHARTHARTQTRTHTRTHVYRLDGHAQRSAAHDGRVHGLCGLDIS